ncbi:MULTISPECIES: amidase domain-containing protein [Bacillus]|uniref:amidase domain-containing protein n=1 Tax=Bacillus TaxID=1386 RepID=UPI000BB8AA37|nr:MULTISPECIES: amidase domain-containing protein [Bacillus]
MYKELLRNHIEGLLENYVYKSNRTGRYIMVEDTIIAKKAMHEARGAEIVKCKAKGRIASIENEEGKHVANYELYITYLINHKNKLYLEEEVVHRKAEIIEGELYRDILLSDEGKGNDIELLPSMEEEPLERDIRFKYNRLEAVKYAERWWNSYNPQFKKFEVDCTNYVSQCLNAGGAIMVGYPNRNSGWWMRSQNWSFSWSVAHALRWYLPKAKQGLRSKEVGSARELMPGDVICYDFQGDGRFDHNTFVVAKDQDGMPLVNAHTSNSRMRYWAYEDSTAYTPNIKYKFFHIIG